MYRCLVFMLILFFGCTLTDHYELKLSDEEFTSVLVDIEIGKEASRTASINIQDSLRKLYFNVIAEQYDLSFVELEREISERIGGDHDMDSYYDDVKAKLDSLTAKVKPDDDTKKEEKKQPRFKKHRPKN